MASQPVSRHLKELLVKLKGTTMQQKVISEQIEIERRMDQIEQLEDCGINVSAKVEAEYQRLHARWDELEQIARESY